MVTEKRDKFEVIFDILSIIRKNNNSIKPTPLLRASNLNSNSFSKYENYLLQKKFVRFDFDKNNRKYFTLTDKGYNYLSKYNVIKAFVYEFDM